MTPQQMTPQQWLQFGTQMAMLSTAAQNVDLEVLDAIILRASIDLDITGNRGQKLHINKEVQQLTGSPLAQDRLTVGERLELAKVTAQFCRDVRKIHKS